MKVDDILRRIRTALPQFVVESRLESDMIVVLVDEKAMLRMYPDADYVDDAINRTIEEIKGKLTP